MKTTLYELAKNNELIASYIGDKEIYPTEFSLIPAKTVVDKSPHRVTALPLIRENDIELPEDSTQELINIEQQGNLQAFANKIAHQTYYSAFGLESQLRVDTVIDAGGKDNTTTVYGLWLNGQGVHYEVGNNGQIFNAIFKGPSLKESYIKPVFKFDLTANIGIKAPSKYSVFGITGINKDNPLTNVLAKKLMQKVPLIRRNGFVWLMNRTAYSSLEEYRKAKYMAYLPISLEGKPIYISDSIK